MIWQDVKVCEIDIEMMEKIVFLKFFLVETKIYH